MRAHLHNVLTLLSMIKNAGFQEFLTGYLHPEHSFFDYKFNNFDPLKINGVVVREKKLDSKNRQKNAKRYIRIALESLDDYQAKKNRRVQKWISSEVDEKLEILFSFLRKKQYKKASDLLISIIECLSDLALSQFKS